MKKTEIDTKQKEKWSRFYRNWKPFWRNPEISVYEKVILQNIFFYRSDNQGWCISERKMAEDLGISKETASKYIDKLVARGLILTNRKERKRRNMRLSGLLRSPVWTTEKPNIWTTEKPSKYQSKYQINNVSNSSNKRNGKMEKILTPVEIHERIKKLKGEYKKET
ncbi:MAG: hypothetical protein ABH819_03105 [Patescibacteria group bacterium]